MGEGRKDKRGATKPYQARLQGGGKPHLRAALAAVPAAVDVVWLRGTEVRTTPPAPTAAAAAVLGKRRRVKEE